MMSIEGLLDEEESNKTQQNDVDAHYDNARLKNLTESHSIEEDKERESADADLENTLRTLSWGWETTETHENSTVSAEFLDSLSAEDIKSIFNNGEIKENLVKEDENWKKYITIKWERFYIGKYDHWLYKYKNNNGIIYEWTYVFLWNNDCACQFETDNDKIIISYKDTEKTKFGDWRSLVITGNVRSANGIDMRHTKFDNWYHYFPSNNGPDLKLPCIETDELIWEITSILSKLKDSKEQCNIIDERTLQVWDTSYKLPINIADEVAKWINNYYN